MVAVLGPQLPDAIGPGGGSPDRPPRYPFRRGDAAGSDASRSCDVEHASQKPDFAFQPWNHPGGFGPVTIGTRLLFALHEAIFRNTTKRSIDTLDRNELDARSLELLPPPEQQLFHWLSGGFHFEEITPWSSFDWANLNVLQAMVNRPFGGRSAGQHHTLVSNPRSSSWHRARLVWFGGVRIARLWRCWGDSPRSDWLAEHAPPCGLVAIASELARIDSKRSTDLYERAMRQADAEGTDLSPYIRASYALGMQAFRAEDIDRAIMMFRQAAFGVPIGREPDINAASNSFAMGWRHSAAACVCGGGGSRIRPCASCIGSFLGTHGQHDRGRTCIGSMLGGSW